MARSARASNTRLPLERDSFVGRGQELKELRRLLTQAPLVTLCGSGGVGKTRLALRAAATLASAFADGVWFVELADLTRGERLEQFVARSIGQREPLGSAAAAQSLAGYLSDRSALLVLDNCEHIVDAVADLTDALLRECPGLRIIATSREALRTTGEAVLRLDPLTVPATRAARQPEELLGYDSVSLFTQRAATAEPAFTLDQENLQAVMTIVQRVDGVPLALELAAAQLRTLSAHELADRLDNPLGLLRSGRRDHPRRHQTLRESVEWSYAGCTAAERLLWNRLSVFVDGFELDAVEGVCGFGELAAERVLDLLASLVDKSVVSRIAYGAHSRYRLLDSIRGYGAEKLRAYGEREEVVQRHARWFASLAHETRDMILSPPLPALWRRLDREQGNLEMAFETLTTPPGASNEGARMVVSLWGYWVTRGTITTGRAWVGRALDGHDVNDDFELLWNAYIGAMLAGMQGDLDTGELYVTEARTRAEELDDPVSRAYAEAAAGWIARCAGDYSTAVAILREVCRVYREAQLTAALLEPLCGLIISAGLAGDVDLARACFDEAMAISDAHGDVILRAYALGHWGAVLWLTGDRDEVEQVLEESLRAGDRLDEMLMAVEALSWLAVLACERGENERAAVLLGAAASRSRDLGVTPFLGIAGQVDGELEGEADLTQLLQQALGRTAYQRAYDRGRTMDHHEALAFATRDDIDAVADSSPQDSAPTDVTLTSRELDVAQLLAEGMTNKEVAARLVISTRTVRGHVESILAKLGFANRAQVAAWYTEHFQR